MFEFIPFSKPTYWLNYSAGLATTMGATLGDVEMAMRPYLAFVDENRSFFENAKRQDPLVFNGKPAAVDDQVAKFVFDSTPIWTGGFVSEGERLARRADQFLSSGQRLSAAATYKRASALVAIGEWSMQAGDEKRAAFDRARVLTMQAITLAEDVFEPVRIPYLDTYLEGMFWPAPGVREPQPLAIVFNGLHSYMDWYWQNGFVQMLNARGMAVLTFDCPGSGHARFHQGLHLNPETELYSKAALDWAETRTDIDMSRVASVGCSFGGYRCLRAASTDQRYRMCMAWGGYYDTPQAQQVRAGETPSVPVGLSGLDRPTILWFNGVDSFAELAEFRARFTLEDVIDGLTCDLVIYHGASDMQVPLQQAKDAYAQAVNARSRELIILTREDGGEQHCHMDNLATALTDMADRVALGIDARMA